MLTQGLLFVALLLGQAKLDIPAEIKPVQGYAEFYPDEKTTCKGITYLGRSGVYPVPSRALKDNRIFLLPVQGLAKGRYKFEAVGSLNDVHVVKEFEVVVGDAPKPPPVDPVDPDDPKPPPVDPELAKVKAALADDRQSSTAVATLSAYYFAASEAARKSQAVNANEFYAEINAVMKAFPDLKPFPKTRGQVVATKLREAWGADVPADAPATPERKIAMAMVYETYAKLIQEASK